MTNIKDYKTTVAGAVALLTFALSHFFNVAIPQNVQSAIYTLCIFAIGFFAKDSQKGGSNERTNTKDN